MPIVFLFSVLFFVEEPKEFKQLKNMKDSKNRDCLAQIQVAGRPFFSVNALCQRVNFHENS